MLYKSMGQNKVILTPPIDLLLRFCPKSRSFAKSLSMVKYRFRMRCFAAKGPQGREGWPKRPIAGGLVAQKNSRRAPLGRGRPGVLVRGKPLARG